MRISCTLRNVSIKIICDSAARKRPVDLPLSEYLVNHVKELADNLSGLVESLLAVYIASESRERIMQLQAVLAAVAQ
jgi:hypothetical protein